MSSGSESDEEFVPGEPEQLSEEDSADEETDLQFEKEQEIKTKKRKAAQETNSKKKRRTRNSRKEPTPEPEPVKEPETNLNPDEEKKREEDLWAKFLEGTDSKPKPAPKETPTTSQPAKPVSSVAAENVKTQAKSSTDDDKARERRIFEFAGETIVVENSIIKEKIKTAESAAAVSKLVPPLARGRGSGLSDVLGQLNKKNKLSTLEKSKLDWETYKKDQDIDEEIQNHNKGKKGYLDRQDFLERADHRQYEIERDLRMSRRSNR